MVDWGLRWCIDVRCIYYYYILYIIYYIHTHTHILLLLLYIILSSTLPNNHSPSHHSLLFFPTLLIFQSSSPSLQLSLPLPIQVYLLFSYFPLSLLPIYHPLFFSPSLLFLLPLFLHMSRHPLIPNLSSHSPINSWCTYLFSPNPIFRFSRLKVVRELTWIVLRFSFQIPF